MEIPALIDPLEKRMIQSLESDQDVQLGALSYGEVVKIRIAKTKRINSNGNRLLRIPVDIATSGLRVGLGVPLVGPTSGTFTLHYSDDSAVLPYNFTAADLNTALSGMGDYAGGGFATSLGNGLFTITANANGAKVAFSVTGLDALSPQSTVEIYQVQVGDEVGEGHRDIQSIRVVQLPAVSTDAFVYSDPANVIATQVLAGGGGANEIIALSFPGEPYGGFWGLNFVDLGGVSTPLVPWGATKEQIQAAIFAAAPTGMAALTDVQVGIQEDGQVILSFQGALANTSIGEVGGISTALRGIRYMEGSLDLRDIDAGRLLGSSASVDLLLDIEEIPAGGVPEKLLLYSVRLVSPVLPVLPF